MPHPIQSMKFITDPRAGACRSEDGQYSLTVDEDDDVQVHDASGEPVGVRWPMARRSVRIEGFFTDPLTGHALSVGGYYGFSRGPGGLIHAFDRLGNKSETGASDVAAPYLAAEFAPDESHARMAPAIMEFMVEKFVNDWDSMVPETERAVDMMSRHGKHSKEAPFRIVCRNAMMTVSNHGSATRSNGIFCITLDPQGSLHIRSLDDGPTSAVVGRFARELHAFHFGKGSRRPRRFDGFVEKLLDASARGVVGDPVPA